MLRSSRNETRGPPASSDEPQHRRRKHAIQVAFEILEIVSKIDRRLIPSRRFFLEIDDRFIRKTENRWPVFVIVTSDGTEISAGAHEKQFNNWTLGLAPRGVSGHALVIKSGTGMPEMMALNVTQNAGGHYDMMNTTTPLPEKMKALAVQIAGDYDQMRS